MHRDAHPASAPAVCPSHLRRQRPPAWIGRFPSLQPRPRRPRQGASRREHGQFAREWEGLPKAPSPGYVV
eukprot:950177-Amorphochlora_amoeboformis.AAC.1